MNKNENSSYTKQRELMVEHQIEDRGIKNRKVLDAIRKVERHHFIPEQFKAYAYEDTPLPLDNGQTISQPYIVALMTELLEPDKSKKILEIGTGSGYQTAILAELYGEVYTIEIIRDLAEQAKNKLDKLSYMNIHFKIGNGYKGWKKYAPYDAIIVTCAPDAVPEALTEQLTEGGKMVIPVGSSFNQMLILLEKKNGKFIEKNIAPVRFVPMVKEQNSMEN